MWRYFPLVMCHFDNLFFSAVCPTYSHNPAPRVLRSFDGMAAATVYRCRVWQVVTYHMCGQSHGSEEGHLLRPLAPVVLYTALEILSIVPHPSEQHHTSMTKPDLLLSNCTFMHIFRRSSSGLASS